MSRSDRSQNEGSQRDSEAKTRNALMNLAERLGLFPGMGKTVNLRAPQICATCRPAGQRLRDGMRDRLYA
jgi:hypothetical protein